MTKVKRVEKSPEHGKSRSKEWPVVVYVWMLGSAFIGYVIGRIVLDAYPHPYHWASGLVGGVVGILLGWAWYRWRGDIFQ